MSTDRDQFLGAVCDLIAAFAEGEAPDVDAIVSRHIDEWPTDAGTVKARRFAAALLTDLGDVFAAVTGGDLGDNLEDGIDYIRNRPTLGAGVELVEDAAEQIRGAAAPPDQPAIDASAAGDRHPCSAHGTHRRGRPRRGRHRR